MPNTMSADGTPPVTAMWPRTGKGCFPCGLWKKRHDAHVALDSLWKNGIMSRKEAYRLLQLSMGLPAEDAHIAKFSAARCDEVIALSRRFRAAAARAA